MKRLSEWKKHLRSIFRDIGHREGESGWQGGNHILRAANDPGLFENLAADSVRVRPVGLRGFSKRSGVGILNGFVEYAADNRCARVVEIFPDFAVVQAFCEE